MAKSVTKYAIPMGICADLAQAGLEWAGHRDIGKAVGMSGNIASGALMGIPFGLRGAACHWSSGRVCSVGSWRDHWSTAG